MLIIYAYIVYIILVYYRANDMNGHSYICLSLSISNSFPVYVHAVFHFVSPLEIHNLYFGKHNKGDKSYKFMLQVANFHR